MKRLTDYFSDLPTALADGNYPFAEFMERAPDPDKTRDYFLSALEERTTLDITDMMEVLVTGQMLSMNFKGMTGCVPPWFSTLTEWALPESDHDLNVRIKEVVNFPVRRWGTLTVGMTASQMVHLMRRPDNTIDRDEMTTLPKLSPDEIAEAFREEHPIMQRHSHDVAANIGWYLLMYPFIRTNRGMLGPLYEVHTVLDHDGKPLVLPHIEGDYLKWEKDDTSHVAIWNEWTSSAPLGRAIFSGNTLHTPNDRSVIAFSTVFVMPTLHAFELANYRNIRPRPVEPRYASRQERRDAERRGDPPLTKYHILEILPAGSTNAKLARPLGEVMREMPLHAVRRHKRVYTKEAPLFGRFGDPRYYGTFWIAPHTRGDREKGVVQKDYIETARTVEIAEADRHGITPVIA